MEMCEVELGKLAATDRLVVRLTRPRIATRKAVPQMALSDCSTAPPPPIPESTGDWSKSFIKTEPTQMIRYSFVLVNVNVIVYKQTSDNAFDRVRGERCATTCGPSGQEPSSAETSALPTLSNASDAHAAQIRRPRIRCSNQTDKIRKNLVINL